MPQPKSTNQRKQDYPDILDVIFNYEGQGDYQLIIDHLNFLDSKNIFAGKIVTLCNLPEMRPLYVSSSVEKVFGYRPEELLKSNKFDLSGMKQTKYFRKISKYVGKFHNPDIDNNSHDVKYISGGIPFRHKDGSIRRTLTKYQIDFMPKGVLPKVDVFVTYDITELLKEDSFWIYQEKIVNGKRVCQFNSGHKVERHLISPREKEVLQMIAQGKSSKEIASSLTISIATVSQHRKNMLGRTRAKDSSSLIQLCKICEVL